jgi:hypothetical protein
MQKLPKLSKLQQMRALRKIGSHVANIYWFCGYCNPQVSTNGGVSVAWGMAHRLSPLKTANLFGSLIPGRSDAANLTSQMNACSKGALNFQPATGGNGAIQNGWIEVKIAQSTNGVKGGTVQNWCVAKVQETVGSAAQWDHINVILPGNGAYLAFTM